MFIIQMRALKTFAVRANLAICQKVSKFKYILTMIQTYKSRGSQIITNNTNLIFQKYEKLLNLKRKAFKAMTQEKSILTVG